MTRDWKLPTGINEEGTPQIQDGTQILSYLCSVLNLWGDSAAAQSREFRASDSQYNNCITAVIKPATYVIAAALKTLFTASLSCC